MPEPIQIPILVPKTPEMERGVSTYKTQDWSWLVYAGIFALIAFWKEPVAALSGLQNHRRVRRSVRYQMGDLNSVVDADFSGNIMTCVDKDIYYKYPDPDAPGNKAYVRCRRFAPTQYESYDILPMSESAKDLLDIGMNALSKDTTYAGISRAKVLATASRIADYSRSDKIELEHIAESLQDGGDPNIFVGKWVSEIIYNQLVDKGLHKIEKEHFDKLTTDRFIPYILERVRQVYGVDVKPALEREYKRFNNTRFPKDYDKYQIMREYFADLQQRQHRGTIIKGAAPVQLIQKPLSGLSGR